MKSRKEAHEALRRRFQEALGARRMKDREERLLPSKTPRPRYDAIFLEGLEWLDSL